MLSLSLSICICFVCSCCNNSIFVSSVFFLLACSLCLKCLSTLHWTNTFKYFFAYIRRAYTIFGFCTSIFCFYFFFYFWCMRIREIFNRSCYLLAVSIASSHCCPIRLNVFHASLNHHVWLDFYVRWPTIWSVDYRGKFANWQIRPKFPAPKMEHWFEFDDNRLHVYVNCSFAIEAKFH